MSYSATGSQYANPTYMSTWATTPSPTRDATFGPYETQANGQIFSDAASTYKRKLNQYLQTGKGGLYQTQASYTTPEANDLLKSMTSKGWELNGYTPFEGGASFGSSGDIATGFNEAINFFNDAAKSVGYKAPNSGGSGGNYDGSNHASGSGGDMSSSYGGVSAVNPQAGQANELDAFKRYEDAAFNNASGRLSPFLDQQTAQFNQQMANQGIPVGSDAYNKAMTSMNLGQTDAMNNAAFDAMGFGAQLQDQSFGQSNARSQLANSLLQAQMSKDVGMANVGLGQASLAQQGNQFGKELSQQGNQFNDTLGYKYDTFYDTMSNDNYNFDQTMNYNYWDRGNSFDLANNAMNSNDYWNAYNAGPPGTTQYDDDLIMALLGQGPPGVAAMDPSSAYASQVRSGTDMGVINSNQNSGWLQGMLSGAGDFGIFQPKQGG